MTSEPIPHRLYPELFRVCIIALVALLMSGCGIHFNPPVPTVGMTANPSAVNASATSTLTITATNATQVKITGTDGSSYVLSANGGVQSVHPATSTTYTAVATGTGGTASATATVTVMAAPVPVVAITANPTLILPGGSSSLTVTASSSAQVAVTGTDGSSYALSTSGGVQSVHPATSTTYTAVATGTGGTASAIAIVTVMAAPVPVVAITANPTSILSGGSSGITVTATNATQVTVTGTDGSSFALPSGGGMQSVSPAVTTTYTATATGAGGAVSATAVLTVAPIPAPIVKISGTPIAIQAGSSSILVVTASGATHVKLTGSDGSSYTLLASGGTQGVTPSVTTMYTAVATGVGGTSTAGITVTVIPNPPPTVSIAANPVAVFAGSSSTLTVNAVNATQVTITGTDGTSYSLQSSGGTQTVSPATTTTYTAMAVGNGGRASSTATLTVTPNPIPTVTLTANPVSIISDNASILTVTATNATQVIVTGTDKSTYSLTTSGGTQSVSPAATVTYTATATGPGGGVTASATVAVTPAGTILSIDHVVFMLQENHTFDNYFGMLNPYRKLNGMNIGDDGKDYEVDGIDDKLATIGNMDDEGATYALFKFKTTCIDDETSAWLASYGDANRYNFLVTRPILMDGFVHNAEGYAKSCALPGAAGSCSGNFTDLTGQRSMGYYDEGILNYYYFMASQFALSDRWFSPVSSKSIDNRIATFTGGTTQGLVYDPGSNDHLSQLDIPNIFQELDQASVSWKIYYTATQGFCLSESNCTGPPSAFYPATDFSSLTYSYQYLYENPTGVACTAPTQQSSVVGDSSNSFCIDPNHIAPLSTYFSDLSAATLPSFAFIEAGYGNNDEHPGSGQSILEGQAQVATIVNSLMSSTEWSDSVFFLSYDEGGGPYDHVPPIAGHSNDNTSAALGTIADISQIAVNPDSYNPCLPAGGIPTLHCDLTVIDPGANSGDAAATQGFAAQLGFRIPNMIVSPFSRRHYVSHTPMDHTAVIKFVENRFIGSAAHLTARDAIQPDLLEFFDFNNIPWSAPPAPPQPTTDVSLGYNSCTPANMGP